MPPTPVPRSPLATLAAATIVAASLAAGGCSRPPSGAAAGAAPSPAPTPASAAACCLEAGLEVAERHRAPAIATRRFTHDQLWAVLDPLVASPALRVTQVGRSIQGRPIRAVTFGRGPTTVLLWSQMHGDESTATMALADLLGWFADTGADVAQEQMRDRIAERLTVVMVPMLNPDGAELFQRQNAVGVDVNRDADRLATPEARALKSLRDSLRPTFGYNLHDQNARTLAGDDGQQVAIALLAPALDEQGSFGGARANARLVASGIAAVLAREIPGRVARYDDAFNPRAFGDLMQKWGTSTVLIESGALPDDPEKQRLRTMNVVAILSSLDAMATGRYADADPRVYDALPMNARSAVDVLVVGASVMLPGYPEPLRVDLSLNYDEPVARLHPRLREVGDLRGVVALDTIDAPGLFLHPAPSMLTDRDGRKWMRINAPAAFTLRRGREATSAVVRSFGAAVAPDGDTDDAIDGAIDGAIDDAVEGAAGAVMERGIAAADSIIGAAVGTRIPGAVLVVARDGRMLHERAFGHAQLDDYEGRRLAAPRPMRTTTLFDLASVTKVAATTFAVMLLADRGELDVDAPAWRYLPDFRGPRRDSITVRHLLTHTAGLVQWQPLYYHASNAAQAYDAIRDMPLQWGVGEGRHYSDLGFMLLGRIVERVSGQPLDAYLERELYGPLGLHSTLFRPRARGFTDFAATEQGNVYERHMVYDSTFGYRYTGDPTAWNGWRQYVLDGEVDDGNAWYAHGGVAGHAGLFSTAAELRVLVDLVNGRGSYGGHRYLRAETVERFLTRDRYGHYLGWMYPSGMPEGSFAHNGFTGTYVLGVPRYGLSIVLLTNRQNLGTDARGYFPDVAPLQSAVARAIVGGAREAASSSSSSSSSSGR